MRAAEPKHLARAAMPSPSPRADGACRLTVTNAELAAIAETTARKEGRASSRTQCQVDHPGPPTAGPDLRKCKTSCNHQTPAHGARGCSYSYSFGDGAQLRVLPLEEVHYIQAQADQVAFHHEGRDHLKPQRISELEAQLDPRQFVRVHRSFVVNIAQIQSVERTESDAYALHLRSGKRIPVSRSGHERLRGVL